MMADGRGGIRLRLRLTIIVAVSIFALLATGLAYAMANQAEDRVLAHLLMDHFDDDLLESVSPEQADPALRAALADDPGPREIYLPDGRELMAWWPAPDQPIRMLDVQSLESMEMSKGGGYRFGLAAPMLAGIGLLLVLLPTVILVERLLRPLGRLVDGIAALRPGERIRVAEELRHRGDEVGLLAEALAAMLERVDGFVDRERHFSRDASHELRTPVTISNGAIDLLRRNRSLDAAGRRAVDRMARANDDMSALIDAFLLLAKERELEDLRQPVRIGTLVDDALQSHATQLERRGLRIDRRGEVDPAVTVPPAIARIVVRNLVRNAIAHGSGETIEITVADHPPCLRIGNRADAPGAEPDNGLGFGLRIVENCCRRLGWRLHIDHQEDRFTAELRFDITRDDVAKT